MKTVRRDKLLPVASVAAALVLCVVLALSVRSWTRRLDERRRRQTAAPPTAAAVAAQYLQNKARLESLAAVEEARLEKRASEYGREIDASVADANRRAADVDREVAAIDRDFRRKMLAQDEWLCRGLERLREQSQGDPQRVARSTPCSPAFGSESKKTGCD